MINQAEAVHPHPSGHLRHVRFLSNYFSRFPRAAFIIREIDGLRFIAIMVVFFVHVAFYLTIKRYGESWASSGDGGEAVVGVLHILGLRAVLLFFVISGFVLGLPFAKAARKGQPVRSLKRYLMRRITRLEPP